jgi:hypothetical protein
MSTSAASASMMATARGGFLKFGPAERNFWRGAALMAVVVLATYGLGVVERRVLERTSVDCFIQEASRTAAHYLAVPHFAIALIFSLTAARNRKAGRRVMILGLLLMGIGLCWLFREFGQRLFSIELLRTTPDYMGFPNFTMLLLVYVYFLIHELRDQVFFYAALSGNTTIKDKKRFISLGSSLVGLSIVGVGVLLWPLVVYEAFRNVLPVMPAEAAPWQRLLTAVAPLLAWFTVAAGLLTWHALGLPGGVRGLLRQHAQLLRVFAGEFLVLGLAMAITGRPYVILVLHFAVWYVFTCDRLRHAKTTTTRSWAWLRTTLPGVQLLHNGLALALCAAGFIWVYAFGGQSLVLSDWIIYWTIIHITMSFLPR